MAAAAVFVEERETVSAAGAPLLTGTFDAELRGDVPDRVEGLAIDAAIAWGRERAPFVLVCFGRCSGYWSAGVTPHGAYPLWPPPALPALVSRPVPEPGWRERPDSAEPITWNVAFQLTPLVDVRSSDFLEVRWQWAERVAHAAAACRAGWDSTAIDEHVEELTACVLQGLKGWTYTAPPVYTVSLAETCATRDQALAQGAARFTPPDRFRVHVDAHPVDLDWTRDD